MRLLLATSAKSRSRLDAELHESVIPEVSQRLAAVQQSYRNDPASTRAQVQTITDGWSAFDALARGDIAAAIKRGAGARERSQVATSVVAVLDPITMSANRLATSEAVDARAAFGRANQDFSTTRMLMLGLLAVLLAVGLSLVTWLTRSVVPPIRRFSKFAERVACGDLSAQLIPEGSDELSDLGRTLDEMVRKRRVDREYEETQFEFTQAMQVTES